MIAINSEETLTELVNTSFAALILYGGENCGVCQAIKPQLQKLAHDEFPQLVMGYVDCQASMSLCATRGVFALPVIHLWFEGQRFAEFAKVFSIGDVRTALERPYRLVMQQGGH